MILAIYKESFRGEWEGKECFFFIGDGKREGAWLKIYRNHCRKQACRKQISLKAFKTIYRGGVERTWCKGDEINSSLSNKKK